MFRLFLCNMTKTFYAVVLYKKSKKKLWKYKHVYKKRIKILVFHLKYILLFLIELCYLDSLKFLKFKILKVVLLWKAFINHRRVIRKKTIENENWLLGSFIPVSSYCSVKFSEKKFINFKHHWKVNNDVQLRNRVYFFIN